MKNKLFSHRLKIHSPFVILMMGFFLLIVFGTCLLLLPFSVRNNYALSIVDAFFTATSAVCVTGLISIPEGVKDVFSPFGYTIIFLLIEIGGLGFVTLVTFIFALTGKKLNISTSVLLKEALNQNSYSNMLHLVKKIVLTSIFIQVIGAIANTIAFLQMGYSFWEAIGIGVFHAGSAFNNAGFDLFGTTSLLQLKQNPLLMTSTAVLIITGGIGFVVLFDLYAKKKYSLLTLHTKIVMKSTLLILIIGTLLFKFATPSASWDDAFLQVVFARTAGFATIDLMGLQSASIFMLMVIMFIGGSPTSTAGGVKTTTFYAIIKSIGSFAFGNKKTHSFHRTLPDDTVFKSFVLLTFAFSFIIFMAICISIADPTFALREIIFESVSAFGTVGTSLGITAQLKDISKIFLCILMFFGRLGPITFISLLNRRNYQGNEDPICFVEEKIIIG